MYDFGKACEQRQRFALWRHSLSAASYVNSFYKFFVPAASGGYGAFGIGVGASEVGDTYRAGLLVLNLNEKKWNNVGDLVPEAGDL